MKTIAKLLALCLLLGTFAFAQDAPKTGDAKGDQKPASTDTKDTKGKKGKKGKKDKGDKKDTKGDTKPSGDTK